MSRIIAIDPGNMESAFVIYEPEERTVHEYTKLANLELLREVKIWRRAGTQLVIEMLGHYGTGMSVGKEIFRTALWLGRFVEAWGDDDTVDLVLRKSYAAHLCGSALAKDGNIRQAMIDYFGGTSKALGYEPCGACDGRGGIGRGKHRVSCGRCLGNKRAPKGPLYDFAGDEWQALGLAVAYSEGCKVIPKTEWLGTENLSIPAIESNDPDRRVDEGRGLTNQPNLWKGGHHG